MPSSDDSRDRILHQGSTASLGLITNIIMIVQRLFSGYLFELRRSRGYLSQSFSLKRPPLGMKVVEVRIDAAADKFQLRHLRGSLANGIGIPQLANGDKPAGMGRMTLAIDPPGTRSCLNGTDDIVALGVAHHQQFTGFTFQACGQAGVERPLRLYRACIEGEVPDIH